MTQYELTLLLDEEKDLEGLKALITSVSGKLLKEEKWGGKNLSYPIKRRLSALYYNLLVDIDAKKVNELKRGINFNEKVIRYLLSKTNT